MSELQERLTRQEYIRLAVIYCAGQNGNMPSHVRRVLKQKFNLDVFEAEVESECHQLAGETIARLARATRKVAA